MNNSQLIYDFEKVDITNILNGWGEPSFRVSQIWNGLYKSFYEGWGEFSSIPGKLRDKLEQEYIIKTVFQLRKWGSPDGQTNKILFQLPDGNKIETVLMEYYHRNTLCVSTQSGCGMGCKFCATGQMGFYRNLSSGEIVAQVIYFAHLLEKEYKQISNIVLMGMGEPFKNYENVMAAIDRLNDSDGFNFGERRFTISTVGVVPSIQNFAREKRQINLAISLHAADDDLRTELIPSNTIYPIKEILIACKDYIQLTKRRVTFEWALIQGKNDSLEHAKKLAGLLRGLLCHVNIIPLNPTQFYAGAPTPLSDVNKFKSVLVNAGIPCTVRTRRGIDVNAGCGQLAFYRDGKFINK